MSLKLHIFESCAVENSRSYIEWMLQWIVCVFLVPGDLYFSYVKTADANAEGYVYKCNVFNPFLDLTTTGAYSRLQVIPS